MKITITGCSAASATAIQEAIDQSRIEDKKKLERRVFRWGTSGQQVALLFQKLDRELPCAHTIDSGITLAMATTFPDPIVSSLELGASIHRSHDRLHKCLCNFQRISNTKRVTIDVVETFSMFKKRGHALNMIITLLKLAIRSQISPHVIASLLHPHNFEDSLISHIIFKDEELKKIKDTPHYRDLEYKHKKKGRF